MPERAIPALLTVAETAARLSCSPATVRRMISDGELQRVRLRDLPGGSVRIRAADIERLLEGDEPQHQRRRSY
jgi:excisionase family DNA binding protein